MGNEYSRLPRVATPYEILDRYHNQYYTTGKTEDDALFQLDQLLKSKNLPKIKSIPGEENMYYCNIFLSPSGQQLYNPVFFYFEKDSLNRTWGQKSVFQYKACVHL